MSFDLNPSTLFRKIALVPAESHIQMIEATFTYFGTLGDWHKDPDGVEVVREVRDRMVQDLKGFTAEPSRQELQELCGQWRAQRIEPEGEASYPPDMFIKSVCQVIEMS